jgi:16S rRNA (guanine966-N2)-methyltransferase
MRIIGGSSRGTALASVGKGDSAAHLRPTTDRVRESIFNLLINGGYGDPVSDARVLDLFAGTGALGFEALSRGASHVLFVDDGVKARALIRQNTDILRAIGKTKLYRRDATKMGPLNGDPYDLVFLDPPYGKGLGEQAMNACLEGGWLKPDALCVWEENAQQIAPSGFSMIDARKYGDTWVHILGIAD